MNKRQKKKRGKDDITLILKCNMCLRTADYVKLKSTIQHMLDNGGVVILPPYIEVVQVVKGQHNCKVIIKQESEAGK